MRSEYKILLTISSFVFITMPVSKGIRATKTSLGSKPHVYESVQTTNETHANRLRISIGYCHRPVINRMQNFSCSSSSKDVILNLDTAGPSVFTHPVFTECEELIESIMAYNLTDSTLEEYQNLFSNLPHLKKMMILDLNISRLTKDFFSGLPELEDLDVSGNIQNIDPDVFTGLPNLKYLRLWYINLEESHLESMQNLPNLEELVITGCNVSNINALKVSPKFEHLLLQYNRISKSNFTELQNYLLSNSVIIGVMENRFDYESEEELEEDEIYYVTYPPPQLEC